MCLAIPGKIVSIDDQTSVPRMAQVDFGGLIRPVYMDCLEANQGDYIWAHAGFAISILDTEQALASIATFEEIVKLIDENPNEK